MFNFRADLHCHSHFSDGSDSPQILIDTAIELKLSGLSITDHDTVEAYSSIGLLEYAKQKKFPLLPGIEFSASHKGEPVHILGYSFLPQNEFINALCKKHAFRRNDRNRRIIGALRLLGIPITFEELSEVVIDPYEGSEKIKRTIGRPHIALLLVKKGVVSSVKEAFNKYLAEGKAAFDPGERISVEETIDCIHKANGLAIIAHPHLIDKASILRELLRMPFDGIEGYYAKMAPSEEARFIKLGKERNWIITGGSDYHGIVKPNNPLGASWVSEEVFQKLYQHYLNQKAI